MAYNFELFVSRIIVWSYNCLLRIFISYLKLYNYVQTNDSIRGWLRERKLERVWSTLTADMFVDDKINLEQSGIVVVTATEDLVCVW